MRSDLLRKLMETHCDDDKGEYKDVMISGPHDYLLMALHQEELQAQPDMTKVTAGMLNMDDTILALAANWLEKKGYITGAEILYPADSNMPSGVNLEHVRLTAEGIEYEKRLG